MKLIYLKFKPLFKTPERARRGRARGRACHPEAKGGADIQTSHANIAIKNIDIGSKYSKLNLRRE